MPSTPRANPLTTVMRLRANAPARSAVASLPYEDTCRVPTTANIENYLDIVEEKYLLRRLIGAAHDVITRSFERQDDVKAWVDEVEKELFEITAERASKGAVHVNEVLKGAMKSIDHLCETHGMTGIRRLVKLIASNPNMDSLLQDELRLSYEAFEHEVASYIVKRYGA